MRIFLSGGCKNGKSFLAQQLCLRQCRAQHPHYYVATMQPVDSEDTARIARHVQERAGQGFVTVESPRASSLAQLWEQCNPAGSFLLDSLTALLANEMFCTAACDANSVGRTSAALEQLLSRVENLVLVSDFLYADAARYDADTERYRRGLAALDKLCAARCDAVIEVCGGTCFFHKGANDVKTLL